MTNVKNFNEKNNYVILFKGSDDEGAYEKSDLNSHTETKDPIMLTAQQKKEAKARAKKRLEEIEKQVVIAKSNYIQLGGKLEDTNNEYHNEQKAIKYKKSFNFKNI